MGEGISPISPEDLKMYEDEATEEALARKKFEKANDEENKDAVMGNLGQKAHEDEQLDQAS